MSSVPIPSKGDIVTIENKQYRVLKVSGTVVEVLAMYDSSTSQKFNTSGNSNVYANSSLDVYLSQTFYNSLSSAMQAAIVAKTFQQDSWKWNGGTSALANYAGTYQTTKNYTLSLMSTTFGSSITRKCYALSCQDVIDYLGVTTSMGSADTTLTSENVRKMFWNQTTSQGSTYPWLRSALSSNSAFAYRVRGDSGSLSDSRVSNDYAVRPAFQIDWETLYPSTPTLTFKHFYDAGTIGSGTVKFRHYSQQEPSSGNVIKAGTYRFNEELTFAYSPNVDQELNFTSNSQSCFEIGLVAEDTGSPIAIISYGIEAEADYIEVYHSNGGWTNASYKTIIVETDQIVGDEFYTWFAANTTKLS